MHSRRDARPQLQFAMAPRRPALQYNPCAWKPFLDVPKALASKKLRIQDYNYLAGKLFKWRRIYGTIPSNTSWVWNWYPDGQVWLKAVNEHGVDHAVSMMTQSAEYLV